MKAVNTSLSDNISPEKAKILNKIIIVVSIQKVLFPKYVFFFIFIIHRYVELIYKFIHIIVYMRKEGILSITERVIKYLEKHEGSSIHSISSALKIHWDTTIKILEFLKKINLAKERKGKKTFRNERLFSLK